MYIFNKKNLYFIYAIQIQYKIQFCWIRFEEAW